VDALGRDRADFEVSPLRVFLPIVLLASMVMIVAFPAVTEGHAFPVRSEPRVGWTIGTSPQKVTIWFDGELEPAFSSIVVYNSTKQQVDKRNSRVTGSDNSVLEVDLPGLGTGIYHVYWKALSKDTHVTEGDFTFTIAAKGH
jgi:methionine-rich copper-binding protein CopC